MTDETLDQIKRDYRIEWDIERVVALVIEHVRDATISQLLANPDPADPVVAAWSEVSAQDREFVVTSVVDNTALTFFSTIDTGWLLLRYTTRENETVLSEDTWAGEVAGWYLTFATEFAKFGFYDLITGEYMESKSL